jgi:carbohydrate kinase (thermoresistant glucokinase family)
MGVSGVGKSTIGALLAERLNLSFVDGDQLHSASNKAKMAAGKALDDADRAPWLDAVAKVLRAGEVIVACSALKRKYRDTLRNAAPEVRFIYLSGARGLLEDRLAARSHEYMPPGMLTSQLEALEPPDEREASLKIDIRNSPAEIADIAARWLQIPWP